MIDILDMLIKNEITEDEAYDILDDVVEKFHNGELLIDPYDEMGFDEYERTADAHALRLGVLASWRKNGWPTECSRCGTKIDYKKYYWTIKNDKLVRFKCCFK